MDRTSDFQQLLNNSQINSSRSNIKNRKKSISILTNKKEKEDENSPTVSSAIFLQNCLSVLKEIKELSALLDEKMKELKKEPLSILEPQFEEEFRSATLLAHTRIANLKEELDNLSTIYQLETNQGFIKMATLGWSSWLSKKFYSQGSSDSDLSDSTSSQLLLHYELILGHVRRRHGILLENLEKLKSISEEREDRKRRILTKAIHPIDIHKTPSTVKHPSIITHQNMTIDNKSKDHNHHNHGHHTLSTIEFQEKYGLSQAQMQELAQSSDILLEEFNALNKELDSTEASILRIGQLQGMLQENLLVQQSLSERIFDDALDALTSVKKGNEQIGMAAERPSTFRMAMVMLILFITVMILFMHWYND